MAKVPGFIQRNHTYEVPKTGYHRTVPIESVDDNTFKGKSGGTKGLLILEPNYTVQLSIEAFMDNGMVGVFVEKFDIYGKPLEPFGILISRDDLLKIIQPPEKY